MCSVLGHRSPLCKRYPHSVLAKRNVLCLHAPTLVILQKVPRLGHVKTWTVSIGFPVLRCCAKGAWPQSCVGVRCFCCPLKSRLLHKSGTDTASSGCNVFLVCPSSPPLLCKGERMSRFGFGSTQCGSVVRVHRFTLRSHS